MLARVRTPLLIMVLVAVTGACGDEEPPPPVPQILDITVSSIHLEPDQMVTVTAVVLPAAPEVPIASVQLVRGARQIAPFAEQSPGVFVATATWAAMAGDDLGGRMGEAVDAPATVRVVDVAAHSAERTTAVTLACRFDEEAICHGGCVDAYNDFHHCGGCDLACSGQVTGGVDDAFATCHAGRCGTGSVLTDDRASCDEICGDLRFAGRPLTCRPLCRSRSSGTFEFGTGMSAVIAYYDDAPFGFVFDPCDMTPPSTELNGNVTAPYTSQRCCCEATFPPP